MQSIIVSLSAEHIIKVKYGNCSEVGGLSQRNIVTCLQVEQHPPDHYEQKQEWCVESGQVACHLTNSGL